MFQHYIAEILILIFLSITFVLSSIEKILDWQGNISFIKNHFNTSILKNYVPFLLAIILLLEILACSFMFIGIYQLLFLNSTYFALLGIELCSLIIIFLLIGQRLAKDYMGAMSLTVYFILTILGIYFLNK